MINTLPGCALKILLTDIQQQLALCINTSVKLWLECFSGEINAMYCSVLSKNMLIVSSSEELVQAHTTCSSAIQSILKPVLWSVTVDC